MSNIGAIAEVHHPWVRSSVKDATQYTMDEAERNARLTLLAEAHAGNAGALCILWETYRLRLPLVEARLPFALPWDRSAPQACGGGRKTRKRRCGPARAGTRRASAGFSGPRRGR